jgi:cytochrome c-type biogenesis protein CcmF
MNAMGESALFVAFLVSIYGAAAALLGALKKREDWIRSAEIAVMVNLVLVSTASAALMRAFLSRDFSLNYVWGYSSRALSKAYTITAFWAGQEGSLLLWAWLLALFAAIVVYMNWSRLRDMMPWVTHILMVNSVFFLLLLNFISDPFAPTPGGAPPDGAGLNPLLQNPGMIWHPPTLFIGYVGLTIPYAFALATLLSDRRDNDWLTATRSWTVFSWIFLGIGILLGAWWAYVELGWGGYWAWDPVENASLLPWLTSTAFMHSMMMQQRRGMMRRWNVSLIIFTYWLVIFGTFVTRSGVISSVHAFGKSSLGAFFLSYMIALLLVSFGIVFRKRKLLKTDQELEAFLSRETAFLLTNAVFAAMTFAIFWGTIFPALTEVVVKTKIELGEGFYNRINVPIGLVLMLLLGLCPLLGWRSSDPAKLMKALRIPAVTALAAAITAWAAGVNNIWSLLTLILAGFMAGSIGLEFYRGADAKRKVTGTSWAMSLPAAIWGNRRRYGGYLAHTGMILIFMGLAGAPFTEEATATLKPGELMGVKNYTIKYVKMKKIPYSDKLIDRASIKAFKDRRYIGDLNPERRFYVKRGDRPTSEVAVLSTWSEDLYVALTGYSRDGRASFRVIVNPFVPWLWYGGYVVTLGSILAIIPRRRRPAAAGQGSA